MVNQGSHYTMKIYQCEEGEEEVGAQNLFGNAIQKSQNLSKVRKRMRGESLLPGETRTPVRTPKRRTLKQEKREAAKKKSEEEVGCVMQLELSTAGSITHTLPWLKMECR